jgi:PAS domain S-box-containing protein
MSLALPRLQLNSWPVIAAAVLAFQTIVSLALRQSASRTSFNAVISIVLLLTATAIATLNAVQSKRAIRLFWSFLAIGCGLWALSPVFWIVHVSTDSNLPDFWLSTSLLLLHIVLFIAAMAARPHLQQVSHKPYRTTLNFLLLLFLLVFIYAFFLIPYQTLRWDSSAIISFESWYFVLNLLLLGAIGALMARARQPWKSIYGHLLGASLLYTIVSLFLNILVAKQGAALGSPNVLYSAATCWFVWVALRGRKLALQLEQTVQLDASQPKYTFPFAMLAVIAIPVFGIWDLFRTNEPYKIRVIRLLVVLVSFLFLAVFVWVGEYLAGRDLAADAGSANDRLRLAMESSKSVGWDWDVKSGRDFWFGDLQNMFGIPADAYSGHVEDFRRRIHPDDRGRVWKTVHQAMQTHEPYAAEFRVVRLDASVRWIAAQGKFSYTANGEPERMLGMATDITETKRAEEALRRNEALKGSILSSLENQIAVLDKRGIIIEVNEAWNRSAQANGMTDETAGVGADYLAALRRTAAVRPEAVEVLNCVLPVMAGTSRRCRYDYMCHWAEPPKWFAMTATPLQTAEGGVVVAYKDISDVRQREADLAEAQRLANVGSWHWDPKTDTVIWSEELYRIAGMDPNLPAVSFREHPKLYTAESWERLRRAVEEGKRSGASYELDLEMVRADGATRWVVARGEVYRDSTGHIVGLRGTVHDITDRKRAEQALRESEERFRLVANTAPVLIWMSGPDKLRTYFNKPWLDFTGRTIEAELGNGWTESVYPQDLQKFMAAYTQVFDQREEFKLEYRLRRHDGQYRWVLDSGLPRFKPDGSFAGYIGSCIDVTERKMAEEALSSVGRKLIAAHEEERAWIARELHDDIGQRLALLSIELESLRQIPSHSAREFPGRMHQLLQQTSEIANEIQAISHRLHSSKLEYLGLVAAAKGFCAEISEQQKVKIDFLHDAVPRTLPSEVEVCVFRVLQEALRNAVKHSRVQQIKVELHAGSKDLHLMVRDSGVGFDPGTALLGKGLGLVSMQERLRLVNGELTIHSAPNGGTAVHAHVPLR